MNGQIRNRAKTGIQIVTQVYLNKKNNIEMNSCLIIYISINSLMKS